MVGTSSSNIQIQFQSAIGTGPTHATVAMFAKDGGQFVGLAMIIGNPNAYRQVVLVTLESTNMLTIYKESMPNVIFLHSYHDLVNAKMEFVDNNGGLKLISSTFDELQAMPLQQMQNPITTNLDIINQKVAYLGGEDDIFPPCSVGNGHVQWYSDSHYFSVPYHTRRPSVGSHVEFGNGSYITYKTNFGAIMLAKVLDCLIDARNGDQVFIGLEFLSLQQIQNFGVIIPKYIHSNTILGRKSIQQERFYTRTSFIGYINYMQGKSLFFKFHFLIKMI